jgi:hypothetical protein
VPGAAAVLPLAAGGAQPAVDATATTTTSSSSAVRSLSGRQPSASSSVAGAPAGGGGAVDGSAGSDVAAVAAAGAGSSSSSSQGALPPAVSSQQQQQQQQQQAFDVPAALSQLGLGGGGSSSAATVLQPLDYGFVTTAATISAREVAGGRDKRWERSWEHAMVSSVLEEVGEGGELCSPTCCCYCPAVVQHIQRCSVLLCFVSLLQPPGAPPCQLGLAQLPGHQCARLGGGGL